MQAPRYFLPQGSLFTRLNNRALAADLLLIFWQRPHCFEWHQPYTLRCCQPQIVAIYHSLAPSSWYFILAVIHERCRKSSTSWPI